MYTIKELENFINTPRLHVEPETAIELARQLLQQKQLNPELLKEMNEAVSSLS